MRTTTSSSLTTTSKQLNNKKVYDVTDLWDAGDSQEETGALRGGSTSKRATPRILCAAADSLPGKSRARVEETTEKNCAQRPALGGHPDLDQ